ncbi:MAG: hypothetical protein GX021_03080, partial [Tissierellia bacterium]|nr:hypothetical protein [Tissierellia bacterium]
MATRSETRESLLEGMVTIFNFIGYVPNTIWFDQMSSVALRTRDERGVVKPTDFIDIIKLRPNAFKYSGIYTLLPTSWQDYLKSLDKESYRQAFDVLRMILLEEDMDYADKVLKETLKHKSISP